MSDVGLARDAESVADALIEAASLNRGDPNRVGNLLRFGSAGQLVLTGDMHGNIRNFEKLQRFCALERSPGRNVILHELIHTEPDPVERADISIDLLIRAVEWKRKFPDNVYFLLSNHELSQWQGHEITKGGRSVLRDFERGVALRFGKGADKVMQAVVAYIASLSLAAQSANGVFVSHSLPDPLTIEYFDYTVFTRTLSDADFRPGGPAYQVVWGRFHSPEVVDYFARRVGAKICVCGHTPQESGYNVVGNLIILASDHAHGVLLPIDLHRPVALEEAVASIRKFVAIE